MTRPEPAATATAMELRRRGLDPLIAPMQRIVPVKADLPGPASVQAALIASANALPALVGFHATRLLAVGRASAARARALGFADVLDADGDAAALAALAAVCCDPRGPPLLLAAGEGQGAPLTRLLEQAGFRVSRHTVYAARPVASIPEAALTAWTARTLRAALFFSAETARVFVELVQAADLVGHAEAVDALAIGGPAARTLSALPFRHVRVAVKPTQDAMLAMLT